MEEVWKVMIDYNFKLDTKDINEDFLCVLCKKLLIETRQAPCGCRYCKKCIEEFLKDGPAFCHSGLEECKEEILLLCENITVDHSINRKILKLRVKCPISSCSFEDELRKMEHHLEGCGRKVINCPFTTMGCLHPRSEKDELVNHLQISIPNC